MYLNHTKPINTILVKNEKLLNVKVGGTSNKSLLMTGLKRYEVTEELKVITHPKVL